MAPTEGLERIIGKFSRIVAHNPLQLSADQIGLAQIHARNLGSLQLRETQLSFTAHRRHQTRWPRTEPPLLKEHKPKVNNQQCILSPRGEIFATNRGITQEPLTKKQKII